MLGAMTSLTGGGGMSASSGASSGQDVSNDSNISTGEITVGGLNMAPKQSGFSSDNIIKGGVVVSLAMGAAWAFKKVKKS